MTLKVNKIELQRHCKNLLTCSDLVDSYRTVYSSISNSARQYFGSILAPSTSKSMFIVMHSSKFPSCHMWPYSIPVGTFTDASYTREKKLLVNILCKIPNMLNQYKRSLKPKYLKVNTR